MVGTRIWAFQADADLFYTGGSDGNELVSGRAPSSTAEPSRRVSGGPVMRVRSLVRFGALAAAAALTIDQTTKHFVRASMIAGESIYIAPFFDLRLGLNEGVSFGLLAEWFAGRPWAPVFLALAIITALAVWLLRTDERWEGLGLGCIIGGALGNVADRARLGAVVDFLDFHISGHHWPAFNFADVAIVVGVGLLFSSGIRRKPPSATRGEFPPARSRGGPR